MRRLRVLVAVAAVVAFFAVVAELASPPQPPRGRVSVSARTCDRFAAPGGSDRAKGTRAAPVRSVTRLAALLRPGETGCLRAGTYYEDVALTAAGRPDAPIVLRSFPGERATLDGRLWLRRGADDVVVSDLDLDGRPAQGANADGLPSPTVDAADDSFVRDDVTNDHTGICFVLGSLTFGRAVATTIAASRIHDCGRLPPTNKEHGIYVAHADRTVIESNWIYANADRGVQLYPDAQHTTVEHNVIDGNGEGIIFSGGGGQSSSGNLVAFNIITGATERADVESFYPPGTPPGSGNLVRGNCIRGGQPPVDTSAGGFTLAANTFADPRYRDTEARDYRLQPGSPCASIAPPPPPP
jgi:hypothetical protein